MHVEQQIIFDRYRLDLASERLWSERQEIPLPGTVVTDGALTFCVGEVRKALGDNAKAPQYIETVPRRGFRFIAPVAAEAAPVQGSKFKVQRPPSPPASSLKSQTSPLVGRDAELAQLHQLLDKALSGTRQVVFVTGEPGIGKTTLVENFLWSLASSVQSPESEEKRHQAEKRARDGRLRIPSSSSQAPSLQPLAPRWWVGRGQCIEHYGPGEPYMPILEALGRVCREPRGEQFVTLLHHHAPTWLVQMPTLLQAAELEVLQRKTQGATRERMLRELAEALEAITAERPLVLVLEDLHWSDASTLDLLAFLARRKEPARLLVIGTYRPVEMLNDGHPLQSLTQELYAHRLATEVALGGLSEGDIAKYLEVRFDGAAIAEAPLLTQTLYRRTDGNPLFLVSTVDELEAQGTLTQTENSWTLPGEVVVVGIAESIRHLVARQSGRLAAEERQTLEAASVAGVEFSAAAVAAALTIETIEIERRCEQLAERQQFLRRVGVEAWPDGTLAARYSFLHAVYQQLWHERVTPMQLQHHHLQIGDRKEQAYGARAREIAAELAMHFEQGQDYRKAVQYLRQAGQNALRRSANQEAVPLLARALDLLKTLPDTSERAQQELKLRVTLATPLIALKGYTAPEVEHACRRAQELCQRIGTIPQLFSVLGLLNNLYFNRRELPTAREYATQLLSVAQGAENPRLLLWAHYALAFTLAEQGELLAARAHVEQSLALYDPQQHRLSDFVQDPRVTGLAKLAHILLSLGYSDQALQRSEEALALARELSHPFSLAWVLESVSRLHMRRREPQAAQILAEELLTLVSEQGFSFLLAQETFRRGWDLVARGQRDGIAVMRQGLTDESSSIGNLSLLANAYAKVGQPQEGLNVLSKTLAIINRTQEFAYTAEIYRLKGELVLQQFNGQGSKSQVANPPSAFPNSQLEAEEYFVKAIDIARKQSAKSCELRASTSLARLWQSQGKREDTHQMLSEIYNWFTEGFDTKDLQEAKALLEALKH